MEKHKLGNDYEDHDRNPSPGALYPWLFGAVVLGLLFAFCAVFYVWLYIEQVQNGYRIAKSYERHEELLATQRKLRLEWQRFQDPSYLEELGSKQYKLIPPRADQKLLMR